MLINLNPRSKAYFNNCASLTQSLVIKLETVVDAMNDYVIEAVGLADYKIDELNPSTWRFYMHIRGDYHHIDEIMTVRSLDTLEEIVFSRENLKNHVTTRNAYKFNSEYYRELVARYPDQETLIYGIVDPYLGEAPWDEKEGTILKYDKTLLESAEYDLIPDLQDRIYAHHERWMMDDYCKFDSNYTVGYVSNLYTFALQAIMVIRLSYVRTNKVHTYFMIEYLRAFYYLDQYTDQLTRSQIYYLYRNVDRLSRSVGRQDVFEELVKEILVARNIPLSTYHIRKFNAALEENGSDVINEAIESSLTSTADTNVESILTIADLTGMLDDAAPRNEAVRSSTIASIEDMMVKTRHNDIPTKILYSKVSDNANYSNYSLQDLVANEWLRMIGEGRYTSYYLGNNPATGEPLELDAKASYLVHYYLNSMKYGLEPKGDIPGMQTFSVRAQTIPSREEFASRINSKYDIEEILDVLAEGHVEVDEYTNVYAFFEYCQSVFQKDLEIKDLIANIKNFHLRGMVEASATLLYRRRRFELATGNYKDWMRSVGVDPDLLSPEQAIELDEEIMLSMTGTSEDSNVALVNIHNAMIEIMRKMSSYTVHYVKTVDINGMMLADWPAVRLGDVHIGEEYGDVVDSASDVIDVQLHNSVGGKYTGMVQSRYMEETAMEEVSIDVGSVSSSESVVVKHYIGELKDIALRATITSE